VKTAEKGAQTSRILCPTLRAKTVKLSPSRYLAQIEALPILGHAWLSSLKAKCISLNNLRLLILGS
jgi:hypothetical protein